MQTMVMTAIRYTTKIVNKNNIFKQQRVITLAEVSYHDSKDDCWIIIYDKVYDITNFLDMHPGGAEILMEHAGRDASVVFRGVGHGEETLKILEEFYIGDLPVGERIFRTPGGINLSGIPV